MERQEAPSSTGQPRQAGRSLPAAVLLVLLPILVIGFFFSVLAHQVLVALILALLALVTVIRMARTSQGRR